MRDNPIQFAVVREDPLVEEAVLRRVHAEHALLIASGGCTALSLASRLPDLEIALVDMNGAQLDHVRAKIAALTGAVHMFCSPSEDALARDLSLAGISPSASATVLHHGMAKCDFRFVLTSEI